MRFLRLTAAVLLVTWASEPAASFALVETRAGYSYSGVARAYPDLNGFFEGSHTSVKVSPNPFEVNSDNTTILKTAIGSFGTAEAHGPLEAAAAFGFLKAKVDVTLNATTTKESFESYSAYVDLMSARATAQWRDAIVTKSKKAPVGTVLKIESLFHVEGTLFVKPSGDDAATGRAIGEIELFDASGRRLVDLRAVENFPQLPTDHVDAGTFEVTWDFLVVNGAKRDIGITLQAFGEGTINRGKYPTPPGVATSIVTVDYLNTVTWAGIKSVSVLETGEVIDDWTIESDSGFDYSQPYTVPEPASGLFVATALGALRSRQLQPSRSRA